MFQAGTLVQVHHLQRQSYYQGILAGKSNGVLAMEDPEPNPAMPLEDDAGSHEGTAPLPAGPLLAALPALPARPVLLDADGGHVGHELDGMDVPQRICLRGSTIHAC